MVSVARLNYFMKNYDKALNDLEQAVVYAKNSGSKETLINIYNEYWLIYDDLNDFIRNI